MGASILAAYTHANQRHNIALYYLSLEARQALRSPFAERALSPQTGHSPSLFRRCSLPNHLH
ncbi:hypothetical protein [Scytonema sp. PCC 10023]|uniref:hypothetical protein n=1 Tax=Scytonema sp. PCC 10023 TaxID=1680591 RepID=UPI0039C5AB4A